MFRLRICPFLLFCIFLCQLPSGRVFAQQPKKLSSNDLYLAHMMLQRA